MFKCLPAPLATPREYHRLTNRIANALRTTLGVGEGDKFLLILENDNLSLLSLPCFLKQPGTAAMTNLRDSQNEHAWQIDLIKPKIVFIENRLLDGYYDMLRGRGCQIVVMDPLPAPREGVWDLPTLTATASDTDNDVELDIHRHVALLRFTGGTTGRGKCAAYSVDNLIAARDAALAHPGLELDHHTRFLVVTPLSHAGLLAFLPTFFLGGTNVTLNQLDLEQWADTVEAERVTHSLLVPTVLYRLLELQRLRPRHFLSLRTILYGAAPMSPTKLAELLQCFGPIFAQGYGATEAAMFVSILDKGDHRTDDDAALKRMSSAGRVTPGAEVFICGEDGRELPTGEIGEIRIRCRALIQGYFGNAEGTAAEFVDGAWKSGDLGYLDEGGYLFIVDRLKDMIITGGFNVYAVEVEAALMSHPAVAMVAVVGLPHPEWGEAVHAEVVLRSGASVTAAELLAHAKERIGTYKAPKTVTFVDALPTSVVGKVIRRKVKEKYWKNADRGVS
ncbi:AMP-binding protein [Bradyrhizobium erythrophlei]|uniref:AMP-binding protein n=1 Tax=Bradyrhizobium erythrophlei TaxID=1437360 RepID=UPI0035E95484